jgi:hypothetical protein
VTRLGFKNAQASNIGDFHGHNFIRCIRSDGEKESIGTDDVSGFAKTDCLWLPENGLIGNVFDADSDLFRRFCYIKILIKIKKITFSLTRWKSIIRNYNTETVSDNFADMLQIVSIFHVIFAVKNSIRNNFSRNWVDGKNSSVVLNRISQRLRASVAIVRDDFADLKKWNQQREQKWW